ncbi:hypothetical protein HK100_007341, partial [Physocladia obscura]
LHPSVNKNNLQQTWQMFLGCLLVTVITLARAASTPSTQAVSTYCSGSSNSSSFCIMAVRNTITSTIAFTVYSKSTGWVGFGTGNAMSGSLMFIGWNNGANAVISQRSGNGHNTPSYNSNPDFTVANTPSTVAIPNTANIVYTFTLPDTTSVISTSGSSSFIYAYSSSGPSNPSSPSSNFPQHSSYGGFTLDVSKLGTSTVGSSTADYDYRMVHGIAMFIAWAVLPPAAIFIARYLKDAWGHNWYRSHKWIMLGGVGIFTTAGMFLVELNLADGVQRFTSSNHAIIGTIVALAVYPSQILLGFLSNQLWTASRVAVPWWDKVHWWLGRSVCVLAAVNIHLGLNLYGAGTGLIVVFWIWIVAIFVVFYLMGERKYGGAVHHIAKQASDESLEMHDPRYTPVH